MLLDGKTKYSIGYELLRDNQGNHNLFEIKNQQVQVAKVNTLLEDSVTSVSVYYLVLKTDAKNLISNLYYRNSAGNSYADVDGNRI
jgi:hypothetical protein